MTASKTEVYRLFMAAYFVLLVVSGLIMELALAFPIIASLPYPLYPVMKALHRNIFLYGIVLNLVTGFFLMLFSGFTPNDLKKSAFSFSPSFLIGDFWKFSGKYEWQVWLVLQAGIILGLAGILFQRFQAVAFHELEYPADFIIFATIAVFTIFYIKKKFQTTRDQQGSAAKNFIADRYILIPVFVFFLYFILMNVVRPAGVFSSVSLMPAPALNILETGFVLFVNRYFIVNIILGILFWMVQSADEGQLLRALRLQWSLHLLLFIVNLYFELDDLGNRQRGTGAVVSGMAVYVPYVPGILILNYLRQKQEQILSRSAVKILHYISMFIWIYILGQIIPGVFNFQEVLAFTDWQTAQSHILAAGIALPAAILFIKSLEKTVPEPKKTLAVNLWLFAVIAVVSLNWITGVFQAVLIEKADFWGFLENPGWSSVTAQLHPYRLLRLIFEMILAGVALMHYFRYYRKNHPRHFAK